jgi:hypothetical protein
MRRLAVSWTIRTLSNNSHFPGSLTIKIKGIPVKPPRWLLAVAEPARTLRDFSSLALVRPLLNKLPRGDGHAVMVIPGFMGDDSNK